MYTCYSTAECLPCKIQVHLVHIYIYILHVYLLPMCYAMNVSMQRAIRIKGFLITSNLLNSCGTDSVMENPEIFMERLIGDSFCIMESISLTLIMTKCWQCTNVFQSLLI